MKAKIKKQNYLFIGLMLFGVVLCMNIQSTDMQFNDYYFLFIVSAALNAICAFAIKRIQEKYNIGSFAIAYFSNIVSLLMYSVCTAFWDRSQMLNIFDGLNNLGTLFALFILGSICQTCLLITYYRNLKELPVWIIKAFLLFVPAMSMIIEYVFLRTTIGAMSLLGFAFVLFGALGITVNSKNAQ
jgi:drug/metabolite transporter (DMT)-like permease